jgi:hypothetical protein
MQRHTSIPSRGTAFASIQGCGSVLERPCARRKSLGINRE